MAFNRDELPEGGIESGLVEIGDLLPERMRWLRLARAQAVVGQCRKCGGNLVPIEPPEDEDGEVGEIAWYEMRCVACDTEIAAPNGRVLKRSSARSEMPPGWWKFREDRDREEAKARGAQNGHDHG